MTAKTPSAPNTGLVKQSAPAGLIAVDSYREAHEMATLISKSDIIPAAYRNNVSNCFIAMNMANRMKTEIFTVMQNLHIILGRPSWSSSFLIAAFNSCGDFSKLRYEFVGKPGTDEYGCRAHAVELATGKTLHGSTVTINTAKKEGWWARKDSKWPNMTDQMLMYRAAAFFIRTIAPELAMGMHTAEETEDFIDADPANPDDEISPPAPPQYAEWTEEQFGAFDALMEAIKQAFADNGHAADYDAWAVSWVNLRGQGDAVMAAERLEAILAKLPKQDASSDGRLI
jgi:hypothetical protein